MDKDCSLKKKIFNIIQIGDKSNRISRAFDIFITITIVLNILVTFAQTFDELSRITMGLKAIEYVTLGISVWNMSCESGRQSTYIPISAEDRQNFVF